MTAKKRTTKRKKCVDRSSLAGVCDEMRTAGVPKGATRSATEEAVDPRVLVPFVGGPADGRQARTNLALQSEVRTISIDGQWHSHKYTLESLNTETGSHYFFRHNGLHIEHALRALLANYRPPPQILQRKDS